MKVAFQNPAFFMIRSLSCIESARADKLEIGLIKSATSYTYFNCANINFEWDFKSNWLFSKAYHNHLSVTM